MNRDDLIVRQVAFKGAVELMVGIGNPNNKDWQRVVKEMQYLTETFTKLIKGELKPGEVQ